MIAESSASGAPRSDQCAASNPASLGVRGFGKPMQFVIQSSASYAELNGIANQLVEKLKDNPGLADLDTDLRLNKPEVQIEIDRARAADLGLDVTVIGRTLETLLGGRDVSTFEIGSEQYDVTVALPVADRTSTETLSRIFVRSASGFVNGTTFFFEENTIRLVFNFLEVPDAGGLFAIGFLEFTYAEL